MNNFNELKPDELINLLEKTHGNNLHLRPLSPLRNNKPSPKKTSKPSPKKRPKTRSQTKKKIKGNIKKMAKSPNQKPKVNKSKKRNNPLRKGVAYNSLSNMLKNFAVKKRNNPEKFENINDKLKR